MIVDSLEWPTSLSNKLNLVGLCWRLSPVCPSTETPSSFPTSSGCYLYSEEVVVLDVEAGYLVVDYIVDSVVFFATMVFAADLAPLFGFLKPQV